MREHLIDKFSQTVFDLVIPADHFLRRVNQIVDLSFINPLCADRYKAGPAGRRAEAPECLFRALLVMMFYQIPFETTLVQEIRLNLAYRWFCGIAIGEAVFDHSLFYVIRKRLGAALFEQILTRLVEQCVTHHLIGNAWAFYDTTDIEAAATRYTPYERAVIIARAVIRLLEQPVAGEPDPTQPPAQARPALRRLVAEIAQEVAGAKARAREPIVAKVEQPSQPVTNPAPRPQLERAAQDLVEQLSQPVTTPTALPRLEPAAPDLWNTIPVP